jgi:pre-mRNA-processing factor SLU7
VSLPKSKYEEDIYINNHTTVWGSWWKDHQWGYKCCKQTIKNSYCTGLAGIEAAEASADLMKANIARKEAAEGTLLRKYFCLFILDNLHWM